MSSMISKIVLFEETIPIVFWSAMCFYIALAAFLFVPLLRKRIAPFYHLPAPSDNYIAFFDVVRGLAILWIASFHTWQWLLQFNYKIGIPMVQQGFKGVAVFSVLSGFLVWNSLAKSDLSVKEIGNFIKARFIRVYPIFLVTALFSLMMGYVEEGALTPQDIMADIFMLRVYIYPKIINPVAWFIFVAVFFYMVSPALFIATRRHRLISAVIAFIVLCLMDTYLQREYEILRYFVLGVITWEVDARVKGLKSWWGGIFVTIGLFLLFLDVYSGRDFISEWLVSAFNAIGVGWSLTAQSIIDDVPSFTSIAFGLGFSLFLLGVLKLPHVFDKLSLYPLRLLGIISYSLYMWHGIIIISDFPIFFDGQVGVNISRLPSIYSVYGNFLSLFFLYFPSFIIVSALSYAIVERPFLRSRSRLRA